MNSITVAHAFKLQNLEHSLIPQPMVYFVYEEGREFIKIGYSTNIQKRFQALDQQSPRNLYLLALVMGGPFQEKEFHNVFAVHHHKNEWFKCHNDIMNYFDNPIEKSLKTIISMRPKFVLNVKAFENIENVYSIKNPCPCVEVHTCGLENK